MTLNGVMAFVLRYFTEFGIASGAHCVKVVEDVVVKIVHVRYLISWRVYRLLWCRSQAARACVVGDLFNINAIIAPPCSEIR